MILATWKQLWRMASAGRPGMEGRMFRKMMALAVSMMPRYIHNSSLRKALRKERSSTR